jgi:hypothetical protein
VHAAIVQDAPVVVVPSTLPDEAYGMVAALRY